MLGRCASTEEALQVRHRRAAIVVLGFRAVSIFINSGRKNEVYRCMGAGRARRANHYLVLDEPPLDGGTCTAERFGVCDRCRRI